MSLVIINDVEVHLVSRNGSIFANSLEVANVFEKEHKDVVRKIRHFSARGQRNFTPSSYINEQNKSQPMYEMNRDGFMFLAMGFTGEKAENWKLDLIDAFNEAVYSKLKDRFAVSSYMEIPRLKFNEAISMVENITLIDLI